MKKLTQEEFDRAIELVSALQEINPDINTSSVTMSLTMLAPEAPEES